MDSGWGKGSEETLPSFLGCKGDGAELYSDLQDSVNVALQSSRISSSGYVSCLAYLAKLTILDFLVFKYGPAHQNTTL